jgi:putative peptidoglycan lipid II flippase
MSERKHLAIRHAKLTAQIVANAIIGYLFLKLLAVRFGASAEQDIFDIAYSIPFIILNVGGFSFAHAVVTSHFAKLRTIRPQSLEPLFATTLTCVVLGCTVLSGLCALLAGPISLAMAPGFDPKLQTELRSLILLLLPIVFSFGLCTLFSAVSIAHEVPITNELGPLVARLIVIVGLLMGLVGSTLPQVAVALAVSSIAGLALQWRLLHATTRLRVKISLNLRDGDFQSMARQAMGFFFAACVAQASMIYMRRLASINSIGVNAGMTYALSLLSPLGLFFGKPLSQVTGPRFARAFAMGDFKLARAIFDRTVLACLAIGVVGAAAASLLAVPLVRLAYGGGQFGVHATTITAELLAGLVWSLPGSTVLWAALMPLIAVSRSHRPATIYICGYLLQIVFMALFYPIWGRAALVWGCPLAASFQAILACVVVYRALATPRSEVALELAC